MRPRDNPFSAQRLDGLRWRPPAGQPGVDGLLHRLAELGGAAAVVGPKGRGKTTLLECVAEHLEARGETVRRLWLTPHRMPGRRVLHSFPGSVETGDWVLVDGWDHPGRWWRLRLRRAGRRAAGLLVAAHRAHRLPVLLEARSSPRLLAELTGELLAGSDAPETLPAADELFARHAGNLRLALRELYDHCTAVPG